MYADRNSDDGEYWTQKEARENPVSEDKCYRCKIPEEEGDCEYHSLSTGERICDNCLKYGREFKRYLYFDFIVTAGLEPAVRRICHDYGSAVASELEQQYSNDDQIQRISKRFSNARKHDATHDPPQDS